MLGYINISIQCELQPVISTPIATSCSESELSEMDEKMTNVRCMSKRMQQPVKFMCRLFIRNCTALMVYAGSAGIRNCSAFCRTRHDFCQTCRNPNHPNHFHGKSCRNPTHFGVAIKVRHFWWEKSSAHAAMISNAVAAHSLHSF